MRRLLAIVGLLLVFTSLLSCNGAPYTAEQREEIKQAMVVKIMAELMERMNSVLPEIQKNLADAFHERAAELGLSPDKADDFIKSLNAFLEDALNAIVNKQAQPAVEAVVEKVLPPPAEAPSGGFGKILAAILGLAVQAGMASLKKG